MEVDEGGEMVGVSRCATIYRVNLLLIAISGIIFILLNEMLKILQQNGQMSWRAPAMGRPS